MRSRVSTFEFGGGHKHRVHGCVNPITYMSNLRHREVREACSRSHMQYPSNQESSFSANLCSQTLLILPFSKWHIVRLEINKSILMQSSYILLLHHLLNIHQTHVLSWNSDSTDVRVEQNTPGSCSPGFYSH